MTDRRLSVAFGGRTITVDSPNPIVLETLRKRFESLEAPPALASGATRIEPRSEGSIRDIVDRLGYEIVLEMVEARPDLLWMHAASAALNGCAVMLAGPSGRGKSTVVTGLCERGWSFMSDDITPLDPATGLLAPFALTPAVRRHPGVELPAGCVQTLRKAEIHLRKETICRQAAPIGAIVFPKYEAGPAARLLPCSPADAALEMLSCCLNFVRHREAAVRYLCGLVQNFPVYRLSFGAGQNAADLLGQIRPEWATTRRAGLGRA